jgi:hypothetical protein
MPDYEAPGAVRRLPGEKFADFAARQRASQLAARKPKRRRIGKSPLLAEGFKPSSSNPNRDIYKEYVESYEDRLDDLGESPDY